MNYTIHGGNILQGTTEIPGSFSEASALCSLAAFCQKKSLIRNFPTTFGLSKLLELCQVNFPKFEKDNLGNLTVIPEKTTTKSNINLELSSDIEPIFIIPQAIAVSRKVNLKIDEKNLSLFQIFLKALEEFGCIKKVSRGIFLVDKTETKEQLFLDQKLWGPDQASFAVLLAIACGVTLSITNFPKDPRFLSFLSVLPQLGVKVDFTQDQDRESVVINPLLPLDAGLSCAVSYSLHKAGFFAFACAGTGGMATLKKINASELLPITAKLYGFGFDIDSSSPEELKIGRKLDESLDSVDLEIKPYPGFIPSWGMLLVPFLSVFSKNASLIFPKRKSVALLVKELNRLGASIDISEGEFFDLVKIKGKILGGGKKVILDERELILPLLLTALLTKGRTTFANFELVESYYPDVLEALKSLGAKIEQH